MAWFVSDAVLLLKYSEGALQGINTDGPRVVWEAKKTPKLNIEQVCKDSNVRIVYKRCALFPHSKF